MAQTVKGCWCPPWPQGLWLEGLAVGPGEVQQLEDVVRALVDRPGCQRIISVFDPSATQPGLPRITEQSSQELRATPGPT